MLVIYREIIDGIPLFKIEEINIKDYWTITFFVTHSKQQKWDFELRNTDIEYTQKAKHVDLPNYV